MVSALIPGAGGLGSSPGWGHCVVFLGKTLNSHSTSLHPGVQMGTGKLLGKPNKFRGNDLRWTSIPSRGSRNTPSRFMLQKPGRSSGSYDPVGSKASFFFSPKLISNIIKPVTQEQELGIQHFHVKPFFNTVYLAHCSYGVCLGHGCERVREFINKIKAVILKLTKEICLPNCK